ncbi:MAG: glycoside hydrolase family 16 protein [Prolixibacteraceae bacterium]|nr:glycoside hydrolase family 16 protein [Prolixibacteraceae bacterium]
MNLFRSMKPTALIESERKKIRDDYQVYCSVEKSEKLKEFFTLKERVESIPFIEKKKEIESLRYKGSPEEQILNKFNKLQNNKKIVRFFQTLESSELARFRKIENEQLPQRFKELKHYVKGGEFKNDKKLFKASGKSDGQNWENSQGFKKFSEYNSLKQSADLRFYFSFLKSPAYKNFRNIDGSSLLNEYEDLKTEVSSEKFIERKAYLEDNSRYEKTDDFKLLTRFRELDADEEIKLYLKYNDTDAFRFFRRWEPTFSDEFNAPPDKKVWSFETPLARKGPGKNYSTKGQLQYYNLADNFIFDNSILTLQTQAEKIEGVVWDGEYGFVPREFEYASGVAHTLDYFQQEYGHFELKIKASKVKGVISSVSLIDEDEDFAIKLFMQDGKKALGGLVYADQDRKLFKPVKLKTPGNGYVIIQLNWTPEKITWKVNCKEMGSITENVPHVKLGLRIETEVVKPTGNLPHRTDIDWIRCFKARS